MDTKNIIPMRDHLIVELAAKEETSVGGILLINEETNTATGTVISIGEGATSDKDGKLTPLDVKPGDSVLFHNTAGIKVTEKGIFPILVMLREDDILAVSI